MLSLFKSHTKEENAQSLADYLPGGQLYVGKNLDTTNFRKLLRGFASELQLNENVLIETTEEHDASTTTKFILEWERALGIPDECFPGTGTIEERRIHVVAKLAKMNVQTRDDFIDLAAFLGFTVVIESAGESSSGLPYSLPFLLIDFEQSKWIWIVKGTNIVSDLGLPYALPFPLGTQETILQCVFNDLKPAMTKIVFINN